MALTTWPSEMDLNERINCAGRVERELNANGDPTYIGYAPYETTPSDASEWIIEYLVYDSSNKLLSTYRRAGIPWNNRTLILDYLPKIQATAKVAKIQLAAFAVANKYADLKLGVNTFVLSALPVDAKGKYKTTSGIANFTLRGMCDKFLIPNFATGVVGILRVSAFGNASATYKTGVARSTIQLQALSPYAQSYALPIGVAQITLRAFCTATKV